MWTDKYIGLNYVENGRGPEGYDCWGLARLVYKEEFGIDLPSFVENYTSSDSEQVSELIARNRENWKSVALPKSGDLALFNVRGHLAHVGIVVDNTTFLHIREGSDSVLESFDSHRWKKRLQGYYTYQANAHLTAIPHPLKTEKLLAEIVPGTTVEEVVKGYIYSKNIPPELISNSYIFVNGFKVPKDNWSSHVLKSGDLVEYRAVPKGRDTFRLIATIAILYIATQIAGPYGASLAGSAGPATAATSTAYFYAAQTATLVVGTALLNAIAPPIIPTQEQDTSNSGRQQLMITGGQNSFQRYGTIPIVLGKVRLTPPLAAQTLIRYTNDTETYLKMALAWGYGPLQIDHNTLKIGSANFFSYSDATIVTHDRQQEPTATEIDSFNQIYSSDTEQVYHNTVLEYPGHQAPYIRINANLDQLIFKTEPVATEFISGVPVGYTNVTTPATQTISCFVENIINPQFQWVYNNTDPTTTQGQTTWVGFSPSQNNSVLSVGQTYKNSWVGVIVTGTETGTGAPVTVSTWIKFYHLTYVEGQDSPNQQLTSGNHLTIVCDKPQTLYKATNTGWSNIELNYDHEIRFRFYAGTALLVPKAKGNNGYSISVARSGLSPNVETPLIEGNEVVIPKPDEITGDFAWAQPTFTTHKVTTEETGGGEGSSIYVVPVSVQGPRATWIASRSSSSEKLAAEGGWVVSSFINSINSPAKTIEIAIQFPQGVRSIRTEGKDAGKTYGAEAEVRSQIRYQGETSWTPLPNLGIGGVFKNGFTRTVTAAIPLDKQHLPFEVRVRRTTPSDPNIWNNYTQYYQSNLMTVTVYKSESIVNDPPDCKIAKSAISIRASNQLSGQIEGISAEVTSICRIFTGGNGDIGLDGWSQGLWNTRAPTSNPAALFLHVLLHPANPKRIKEEEVISRIDIKQIQRWYRYCEDPVGMRGLSPVGLEVSHYQWRYNNVIAAETSLLEVLKAVCSAGRASPFLVDGKWSVVIDEPKNIVQHFTPHNSWGFESTKRIIELPHALKGKFYDEEKNYQQSEQIAYNTGYDDTNSSLFEELDCVGITNKHLVWDYLKWHYAQTKLRPEIYSLNTDIEYLVCNRGDRVKVSHDVPMWGIETGRISSRIQEDINLLTPVFKLSEKIGYETSKNYTFRIRTNSGGSKTVGLKTSFQVSSYSKAGTIVKLYLNNNGKNPLQPDDVVTVTTGTVIDNTYAVVLEADPNWIKYQQIGGSYVPDSSPSAVTGSITLNTGYYTVVEFNETLNISNCDIDNLFMYGELNRESQDLLVLSIEPQSGTMSARLTLVDYGISTDTENLYNIFTDYRNYTEDLFFDPNITSVPLLQQNYLTNKYPNIDQTKIYSDETVLDVTGPGIYNFGIMVPFTNDKPGGVSLELPPNTKFVQVQATENISNTDNLIIVTELINKGSVKLSGVNEGVTYYIRARYVTEVGVVGPWTNWLSHTVVGRSTPPSIVSGVYYLLTDIGIELNWLPNLEIDYERTEIRQGTTWATGTVIFSGKTTSYTVQRPETGNYTYWFKHYDTLGNESSTATELTAYFNNQTLSYLTVDLTNDNHQLPTNSTGSIVSTYSFSGTEIRVYDGLNILKYNGLGTTAGTWRIDSVVVSETYEPTPGTIVPAAQPGIVSPVIDTVLGDDFATLQDLVSIAENIDKITIIITISGITVLGNSFTVSKNQNIIKSKNNPLYRLETVTPLVAKDAANNINPGEFSTLLANGYIWNGTEFESYGWIGLTPYIENNPETEIFWYRSINYTPEVSNQVTKWVLKLYGEDPLLEGYEVGDTLPQGLSPSSPVYDTEEIRVIYKAVNYDVEIESTNGTVFKLGQGLETTLIAHVFENETEITDILPASRFRWRRVSRNPQPFPNDDASWNLLYFSGYKIITVTVADVSAIATFHCDILSE